MIETLFADKEMVLKYLDHWFLTSANKKVYSVNV
jgi:hypothetical protein